MQVTHIAFFEKRGKSTTNKKKNHSFNGGFGFSNEERDKITHIIIVSSIT